MIWSSSNTLAMSVSEGWMSTKSFTRPSISFASSRTIVLSSSSIFFSKKLGVVFLWSPLRRSKRWLTQSGAFDAGDDGFAAAKIQPYQPELRLHELNNVKGIYLWRVSVSQTQLVCQDRPIGDVAWLPLSNSHSLYIIRCILKQTWSMDLMLSAK